MALRIDTRVTLKALCCSSSGRSACVYRLSHSHTVCAREFSWPPLISYQRNPCTLYQSHFTAILFRDWNVLKKWNAAPAENDAKNVEVCKVIVSGYWQDTLSVVFYLYRMFPLWRAHLHSLTNALSLDDVQSPLSLPWSTCNIKRNTEGDAVSYLNVRFEAIR